MSETKTRKIRHRKHEKAQRTEARTPEPQADESGTEPAEPGRFSLLLAKASRITTALILLAMLVAFVVARGPLERRVAQLRARPIAVAVSWPGVPETPEPLDTWLPAIIQRDLVGVAAASITPDPFDRESLERARAALEATGWFTKVTRVQRLANGRVEIEGEWRTPAAVVVKDNRQYLVGRDGAVMRLAAGASMPRGLFEITSPYAQPPTDERGNPLYGVPWTGGDVQAAIELLDALADLKASRQVAGIDLSEYLSRRDGKLAIVTDTGSRVIWGSPIGELAPGETPVAERLSRLEQLYRDFGRIDAGERRLELYMPRILVDKSAGGNPHALEQ